MKYEWQLMNQINVQLGLNNIRQIETHMSMVAKGDLSASKYFSLSKRLQEKAVLAFAENKTLFFCGTSISTTLLPHGTPYGMGQANDKC